MKLLLCVGLACLVVAVRAGDRPPIDPNCAVLGSRRVNCGNNNGANKTTKAECKKMNCCYNENDQRCFHPIDPCLMPKPCLYGAECVNKPTHPNYDDGAYECICPPGKGPDCRSRQGVCEIEPYNRVACGKVDIFEDLLPDREPGSICEARGCCWNNLTPRVKWCFMPKKKDLPSCKCKGVYP